MENFAEYGHAIASLALWSLVMIVLSVIGGIGKNADNTCACGIPKRDYSNIVYRRSRAYANAMEMAAPFIGATVAAILAGADPFWVNTFASVFLVSRIVLPVVHIRTTIEGLRSAVWMVGLICTISLTVMAVWAAI